MTLGELWELTRGRPARALDNPSEPLSANTAWGCMCVAQDHFSLARKHCARLVAPMSFMCQNIVTSSFYVAWQIMQK